MWSIFKLVIALAGIFLTFGFLITGLIKKDRKRFKQAAIFFIATIAILLITSSIEFALA